MKAITVLIAVFLVVSVALAQLEMSWEQTLDIQQGEVHGMEIMLSAVQKVGGDFIVIGELSSADPTSSGLLVVDMEANGTIQSSNYDLLYGGESLIQDYMIPNRTCKTGNDYVAIPIERNVSGAWTNEGDAQLIIVDVDGDIIDSSYCFDGYGSGEEHVYDYFNSVSLTSDGGYIVAGTCAWGESTDHHAWLFKFDSDLNVEWFTDITSSDEDATCDEGFSAIETHDGGYAMTGVTNWHNDEQSTPHLWLVKVESDGDVEWMSTWEGEYQSIGRGWEVSQLSDDSYTVLGFGTFNSYGKPIIVNFDEDGDYSWGGEYDELANRWCRNAFINKWGYSVFVGYNSVNSDAWIGIFDDEGNFLDSVSYAGDGGVFRGVLQCKDLGFLCVGYCDGSTVYDGYFVNTVDVIIAMEMDLGTLPVVVGNDEIEFDFTVYNKGDKTATVDIDFLIKPVGGELSSILNHYDDLEIESESYETVNDFTVDLDGYADGMYELISFVYNSSTQELICIDEGIFEIDTNEEDEEERADLDANCKLEAPYPNPFNESVAINYKVTDPGDVNISVYDILGRKVLDVAKGFHREGEYRSDLTFSHFSAGVYFVKVDNGFSSDVRKIVLLK